MKGIRLLKIGKDQLQNITCKRTLFSRKEKFSSETLIEKEQKYSAHNYEPIPVVISRGEGVKVWDPEGNCYLDFLAGYAAVNTGHCHPKIVDVIKKQISTLHHTSRAFYNNIFPQYAEYVTKLFGYEKVLPMNSGCEAGETAVKIARKWGYLVKQVAENEGIVLFAENNFWGRSIAAASSSTSKETSEHYGPFTPGFCIIPFDDLGALEDQLKNPNVCAFMVEPIQGEAGVIVPSDRYLKEVRRLCTKYNVLWIADEIQTGIGRTGALLACDHECVRPDILVIGKALTGGFIPVSAVLANDHIMDVITPGTHGSTYGGNPLGCMVAMRTLEVIQEEYLIENAAVQGEKFRAELVCRLPKEIVPEIRGKGLMNAIAINPVYGSASDFCKKLKENGVLAKSCNKSVVRFTPPLVISDAEVSQGIESIIRTVQSLKPLNK